MHNISFHSILLDKNEKNSPNSIISSIKITPSNLKRKKRKIIKIWKKLIISRRDIFKNLLKDIGINYNDLEKKYCLDCGNELEFIDFFYLNSSLGLGKIIELWENNIFQFICIKCSKPKKSK